MPDIDLTPDGQRALYQQLKTQATAAAATSTQVSQQITDLKTKYDAAIQSMADQVTTANQTVTAAEALMGTLFAALGGQVDAPAASGTVLGGEPPTLGAAA